MSQLNRSTIKLIVIIGLLLLLIPLAATGLEVDGTPKTPTAVPTETNTPTATITPTLTITPTTTITPTLTITPTATISSTATVVATATAIATPKSWRYLSIVQHNFVPTPLPTPTATATSEPTCWDSVNNGGFESSTDWIIGNNAYPASYSMVQVRSGARSMRTGIITPADNRESYSSTWQFVSIPADAQNAKLKFWLYPVSSGVRGETKLTPPDFIPTNMAEGVHANDVQLVLIFDQDGTQHNVVYQRANSQTWTGYELDVSAFANQTIQLYFGVYNNGGAGVTGMYVDDVELIWCGSN